jgi:hypothetical protein
MFNETSYNSLSDLGLVKRRICQTAEERGLPLPAECSSGYKLDGGTRKRLKQDIKDSYVSGPPGTQPRKSIDLPNEPVKDEKAKLDPSGSNPEQAGGGFMDFFKNIPPIYLIGGAVALFFVLGKR